MIDVDLNVDFMTFFPKGILKATKKAYNKKYDMIFAVSAVFANN